jgi:hypothetical protein
MRPSKASRSLGLRSSRNQTVFSGMTSSAASLPAVTVANCSCRIRQAFSPKVSPWRSVASG